MKLVFVLVSYGNWFGPTVVMELVLVLAIDLVLVIV